jgi:hypothetical protein
VRLHGHTKTRQRITMQIVRPNAPYHWNGVHMPCAAVYCGAHVQSDPYTFSLTTAVVRDKLRCSHPGLCMHLARGRQRSRCVDSTFIQHCEGKNHTGSWPLARRFFFTWRYREETSNNIVIINLKRVITPRHRVSDPASRCTCHCQYRYCPHPSRKYNVPQPACPHLPAEVVRTA